MKIITIGLIGSALALGLGGGGNVPLSTSIKASPAITLEGEDRPILLQRMIVTATPLPPE